MIFAMEFKKFSEQLFYKQLSKRLLLCGVLNTNQQEMHQLHHTIELIRKRYINLNL